MVPEVTAVLDWIDDHRPDMVDLLWVYIGYRPRRRAKLKSRLSRMGGYTAVDRAI